MVRLRAPPTPDPSLTPGLCARSRWRLRAAAALHFLFVKKKKNARRPQPPSPFLSCRSHRPARAHPVILFFFVPCVSQPNNRKINAKNIKLGDAVHPSSRKARQLTRSVARSDRLKRNAARKTEAKTPRGAFTSFLSLAFPLPHPFLRVKSGSRNRGWRAPREAAREDAIQIVQSAERAEYAGGFGEWQFFKCFVTARVCPLAWLVDPATVLCLSPDLHPHFGDPELPDVTIPKVLALFRGWQGDLNYLDNIPMTRLRREDAPAAREGRAESLEPMPIEPIAST
ncbi:MAG: hypothetical protein BJ554DRAFT_7123 [Olpidium bornovanus]|uniref:Uncharacterized protein n=1 Tax=Olpidium bornovanus TaxID=278681 RepID=A0A8H7ZWP5_9FUNG|nr:MAG: hypothetical protein BJ554DRAFT_7123 [Olpidium bornovanus]